MAERSQLRTHHAGAGLAQRARDGDREALAAILVDFQPLVETYLAQLLDDDPSAVDDVLQEVYLRVVRGIATLRETARIGAWIKSIAWREARAWVRRAQRSRPSPVDPDGLAGPFADGSDQVDRPTDAWLQKVADAIGSMDDGARLTLALFYLRGLPYQHIADFLDLPLGTVKRRLHVARSRLRAATGGDGDPELHRRAATTVHRLLDRALVRAGITEELS